MYMAGPSDVGLNVVVRSSLTPRRPCGDVPVAACARSRLPVRRSRRARLPRARLGPVRRPGTRSAPGSRRRSSWPVPAGPGFRRTTAPGPRPGTAGDAGPVRGPTGCADASVGSCWVGRCPSGGARVGGGTSGGRSSAALPLLLVLVVCDGRRWARRPVVGAGTPWPMQSGKDKGRGSRVSGSAASRRTGERLAQWSARGMEPEGGAVVLGDELAARGAGGGAGDTGAEDADAIDRAVAEVAQPSGGQTGPLAHGEGRLRSGAGDEAAERTRVSAPLAEGPGGDA